jgi:penicillin-binding protein 1A
MHWILVWSWRLCRLVLPLIAAGILILCGTFLYLGPRLPSIDVLRELKFQEPLRVYSKDGLLMGEFGEMRRSPVQYADIPAHLIQAILAAEDDRFLQHSGIDVTGLARAAWELATTRSIQSGGSTITMQVARNYFLSRDQTFTRKFNEILLAIQIERELDKHQILELYLNKIFLGYRAYGIEAAAQVYYGRSIRELSLAEAAMIAGLPKAPSVLNPIDNPARAETRRNWILARMRDLGHISNEEYEQAVNEADTARYHGSRIELRAEYAAEMVRAEMIARYGRAAYVDGYTVHTTLDSRLQQHAQQAVERGLLAYDSRHGYRGPELQLTQQSAQEWGAQLARIPNVGSLEPAVVTEVGERELLLLGKSGEAITIGWDQGISAARRFMSPDYRGPSPKAAAEVAMIGDVVRIRRDGDDWRLSQLPAAQSALISLDASDGAILALIGGLDFRNSKFNRVTQALRQPGSNIKPFIYAAAMENGFTPASIINDAPVVFQDPGLEQVWRPENDTGKFYGPTSLRTGLVNSRNLVSIRLLQQLGIEKAVDYLAKLGFPRADLPPNLSLALGTQISTPLRLAAAYAILANGGYRVEPHLIEEVRLVSGELVSRTRAARACENCRAQTPGAAVEEIASMDELLAIAVEPEAVEADIEEPAIAERVMDPRVAYMIDSILRDAVKHGTGRRALELKRADIAGKTGTTNGPTDAWFSGYAANVVTTSWLGFDQNQPLGRQEYGGSAALPIWVDYMREATRDIPVKERARPDGLVSVRVDPQTGLLASPGQQDARFELFPLENVPPVTPTGDGYIADEYNTMEIF